MGRRDIRESGNNHDPYSVFVVKFCGFVHFYLPRKKAKFFRTKIFAFTVWSFVMLITNQVIEFISNKLADPTTAYMCMLP